MILQYLQTNLYFWTVNDNTDTATETAFYNHVFLQKLFGKNLKLPKHFALFPGMVVPLIFWWLGNNQV